MRYRDLIEKYTGENSYLLRYLRDGKFDPFTYWNEIRVWLSKHEEYLEDFSEALGKEITDADEIDEEEPDVFFKLPIEVQEEAAEWITEWLMRNDPREAPSYAQMGLSQKRLLPRTTWLLHFTNNPDEIADQGFTIGVQDINKLGLTTYFQNQSFEKQFGGYNFAFLAGSRDAINAEYENKYGRHAVMFQNSGVLTYHYSDEENQVIFNGADVDPRDIVILNQRDDGWTVKARRPTNRSYTQDSYTLYAPQAKERMSDFERCQAWVMGHFAQYRHYLTLR